MHLSRESNLGPPALQANTLFKEPFERRYWLPFETSACTTTAPPKPRCCTLLIGDLGWVWLGRICLIWRVEVRIAREGARRLNLSCVRGSRAFETSEQRENCITLGSPLCRGLTRATYILCIEHLRLKRLSRESNPGPPALQANTLCKEPFEQH